MKNKYFTVKTDVKLYKWVVKQATKLGISKSTYIRMVLMEKKNDK